MPGFSRLVSGLRNVNNAMRVVQKTARATAASISSNMRKAADSSERHGRRIVSGLDRLKEDATPRIKDLEYDLETMAMEGNAWAVSLLDTVRQVQQGTVDAGKAIHSMGDGVILFEGQMRSVKDVLADLLPTTGEVQERIQDLRREIQGADLGELIDRLKGQYNAYAQHLAQTIEAYRQGQVTLERVVQLAQQIERQLGGSETATLAEAIERGMLDGTLGGPV